MLAVLQHICQENDVALSMLPDEVCELINLDPAEIEKQRLSGRLRFAEEESGTKHYSIVDIINLKDSIDWKVINKQVESLSFEEEEWWSDFLPFTDKGTAGKVGFIRVPAVPLSFPEKRLFAVNYGSGACVASGVYRNVPWETYSDTTLTDVICTDCSSPTDSDLRVPSNIHNVR